MSDVRVLVVDDDFMVARLHAELVGSLAGFVVAGVAQTGRDALDAASRLHPDIVLLDVYLPDLSGVQVLEELRAGGAPQADVVMITAARDTETVSRALRLGAVHYLVKPFALADLSDRLRQVAAARQQLASDATLAQAEIDRVFGAVRTPTPLRGLPKGLSEPTMRLVVATLRSQDAAESATELADRAGLSRVSARRYLEHLVGMGWVEVTLKYGAAGRPERLYAWVRD
ncbi:response regulator [Nocardioides jiangxiensis]|uniref:Transcriptional regulatory protein n=1 Tax=Nocardioides jiangxiensis TaxID=3064524 RepID=A0ABT9B2B0_9ACTN|nr:response regulator [Nocardioides sp. WY-20]MDO7867303.1 response regulator [Nocardioides sp. WY-20]